MLAGRRLSPTPNRTGNGSFCVVAGLRRQPERLDHWDAVGLIVIGLAIAIGLAVAVGLAGQLQRDLVAGRRLLARATHVGLLGRDGEATQEGALAARGHAAVDFHGALATMTLATAWLPEALPQPGSLQPGHVVAYDHLHGELLEGDLACVVRVHLSPEDLPVQGGHLESHQAILKRLCLHFFIVYTLPGAVAAEPLEGLFGALEAVLTSIRSDICSQVKLDFSWNWPTMACTSEVKAPGYCCVSCSTAL
eukprot:CAMPEP_0179201046 /NCGR_PEP_ID=MMETSP0796-20121207/100057_1 /TAXON_ID=73915 /ORGANISM="Pyrodinium bahamense, Strain pbaha01" /LENGTH=249 /DNA_ID=CAMNT_0020905603 /DNA_START=74 /DNA_END=825 /DNA_ORIENTATION=-